MDEGTAMNSHTLTAIIGSIRIRLPLTERTVVVSHGRKETREDYDDMISRQLDSPLDYPPFVQGILEDDRVTIAVEDGIPDGENVVVAVVQYLVSHGIEPSRLTLVLGTTAEARVQHIRQRLTDLSLTEISVVLHDPNSIDTHAYVAASETADAIYVQRELVDADVTIPIYCARTVECPLSSDLYGIAPGFMDAVSQFRWSIAWLEDNLTHLHQHENLSQEAGWLVGIHFAIAVVPSLDGHVAEVLAGKPDKVFQQATELLTSVDPNAFDLVIAMVDGKEEQQNWLSVARAASQAESLCKTDGRIVVCCDVKKSTKGIRDLASDSPSEEANRRLLKAHVEDAFPAAVLRSIREQRSLYLFSSMKPNEVESFGFAFIDSVASLQHLMEQASKVCIVRGAQY